jgi:hypothetical protein
MFSNLKYEVDVVETEYALLNKSMQLVLKCGKYKGQQLHEVLVLSEGRRYLKWMSSDESTFNDTLKLHINRVLDFAELEMKRFQHSTSSSDSSSCDSSVSSPSSSESSSESPSST